MLLGEFSAVLSSMPMADGDGSSECAPFSQALAS